MIYKKNDSELESTEGEFIEACPNKIHIKRKTSSVQIRVVFWLSDASGYLQGKT